MKTDELWLIKLYWILTSQAFSNDQVSIKGTQTVSRSANWLISSQSIGLMLRENERHWNPKPIIFVCFWGNGHSVHWINVHIKRSEQHICAEEMQWRFRWALEFPESAGILIWMWNFNYSIWLQLNIWSSRRGWGSKPNLKRMGKKIFPK